MDDREEEVEVVVVVVAKSHQLVPFGEK